MLVPVASFTKSFQQPESDRSPHQIRPMPRAIGCSVSAVKRAVAKLQRKNKLRYHGPKKGGKWEVLP
jgi:hypothetical protein